MSHFINLMSSFLIIVFFRNIYGTIISSYLRIKLFVKSFVKRNTGIKMFFVNFFSVRRPASCWSTLSSRRRSATTTWSTWLIDSGSGSWLIPPIQTRRATATPIKPITATTATGTWPSKALCLLTSSSLKIALPWKKRMTTETKRRQSLWRLKITSLSWIET